MEYKTFREKRDSNNEVKKTNYHDIKTHVLQIKEINDGKIYEKKVVFEEFNDLANKELSVSDFGIVSLRVSGMINGMQEIRQIPNIEALDKSLEQFENITSEIESKLNVEQTENE